MENKASIAVTNPVEREPAITPFLDEARELYRKAALRIRR